MLDERRTQHATLGCGTFILIALIVMIFGRQGTSNLEQEVRSLRSEVMELKKAVDSTNSLRDGSMSLRSEIMELKRSVESQTN
jgi:hypothetical protein